MVAIWGLESNFGKFTGTYPTIAALATLAYDGAPPALPRPSCSTRSTIVDAGRRSAGDLKGSWAGAMGQPQFMPSSFLKHAVDFDGDGTIDIWTSAAGRLRLDGELPADRPAGTTASAGGARCASRKAVDGEDRSRRCRCARRAAAPSAS